MKRVLALGAVALALGGCASGPYYDSYGYDAYGNPVYAGPTSYGAPYNAPYYSGPSVSFGYYYYDNDGHRHWREGHDGRTSRDDGRRDDGRRDWNDRNDGRQRLPSDVVPPGSHSGTNPPNSGRVTGSNPIGQDPGAGP